MIVYSQNCHYFRGEYLLCITELQIFLTGRPITHPYFLVALLDWFFVTKNKLLVMKWCTCFIFLENDTKDGTIIRLQLQGAGLHSSII